MSRKGEKVLRKCDGVMGGLSRINNTMKVIGQQKGERSYTIS